MKHEIKNPIIELNRSTLKKEIDELKKYKSFTNHKIGELNREICMLS